MEWGIIERLVRHQVAQLEEPARFVEKVVVVDPSGGPFLRQYDMRLMLRPTARLWTACCGTVWLTG